ncbi:MAG: tetratricopeptide repeat protein [Spirochaetales bacterium]|jgi:tetratricopeptide (TPR) repeat protein|nr:tetratricopeptide repeat protein [Spirochaetales bacterium]
MENVSLRDTDTNVLSPVYDLLARQDFEGAIGRMEDALGANFDNVEVTSALKCAKFWQDRFRMLEKYPSEYEKAEYLMGQWNTFPAFTSRMDLPDRCACVFKNLVFHAALALYESLVDATPTAVKDADILLRVGRCYKALGEYDKALRSLDAANQVKKENAEILAELADSYALVNEMQLSKAYFREAFFINPQAVNLERIESAMICRLADKLKSMGLSGPGIPEWIPVYGVLYNVLNVKRELRSIEYGKLRQSIYSLEVEIREAPAKKEILLPRLLTRYFWLIDHYRLTKSAREKIDEVMLKIKELSPAIYEEYTQ